MLLIKRENVFICGCHYIRQDDMRNSRVHTGKLKRTALWDSYGEATFSASASFLVFIRTMNGILEDAINTM